VHGAAADALQVDRRQPAGDAGEKAGQHHHDPAHAPGVVADELGALRVVAHRVGDAAERVCVSAYMATMLAKVQAAIR